ncbi:hypothetical protein ACIRBX_20580 [Kitasatospora sp. NPDC096147]|uniref:hypothetical protein n=1 Tax=Kitasatospora sp. NPDC096147 TaxID=3364093 RepID=UPI003822AFF5
MSDFSSQRQLLVLAGTALACAQTAQLRPLLLSLTPAGALDRIEIGFGPRIAGFRWHGVDWVVRLVPLLVGGGAYPLRSRWYPAVLRVLGALELLLLAGLAGRLLAGGDLFTRSAGVGVGCLLVLSLVKVRQAGSIGHALFGRHAVGDGQFTPAELTAGRLLDGGDPAGALAALPPAREAEPIGVQLRAASALLTGDLDEAFRLSDRTTPALGSTALLIRAAALVQAVESGALSLPEALPRLSATVRELADGDARSARLGAGGADLARLEGRPEEAVVDARRAIRTAGSGLWWAEAQCSYAAALIAAGRRGEAAVALGRARRWCPEMARPALLEDRLARTEVQG